MNLTAVEIRKPHFSKAIRGYNPDEVDEFVQMIANEWEELHSSNIRAEENAAELRSRLERYERVEQALEEALQTARASAERSTKTAEEKAHLIVERAQNDALEITRTAEADSLNVRRESARYSVRRKEIVVRLRAFLQSELDLLDAFESRTLEDDRDERGRDQEGLYEDGTDEYNPEVQSLSASEANSDHQWTVNPVVSPDHEEGDSTIGIRKETSSATDDIRKIRRILEDMDQEEDA